MHLAHPRCRTRSFGCREFHIAAPQSALRDQRQGALCRPLFLSSPISLPSYQKRASASRSAYLPVPARTIAIAQVTEEIRRFEHAFTSAACRARSRRSPPSPHLGTTSNLEEPITERLTPLCQLNPTGLPSHPASNLILHFTFPPNDNVKRKRPSYHLRRMCHPSPPPPPPLP